ncbi:uncharacterized protein ACLA_071190 [Aspergillus clavatus NRRL 1]|uniref:Uncharacterized protein n=1 Tax=Aspergillus clavatus (strain ATCC 1007 / CBS 513.65 / DSM 816 / NCTC 3887 / NRRL 1 / QM 1276 / 107) TaxID=344612 RepID=A1C6R5_ASPCL|nr:uncharacterized protein ACLA_071190 [Aspergillus clavatus NRRL 1]EAW14086.1 hypothetical protein ACLA_071190 [Aspergillus clavatus NRRL 1]
MPEAEQRHLDLSQKIIEVAATRLDALSGTQIDEHRRQGFTTEYYMLRVYLVVVMKALWMCAMNRVLKHFQTASTKRQHDGLKELSTLIDQRSFDALVLQLEILCKDGILDYDEYGETLDATLAAMRLEEAEIKM